MTKAFAIKQYWPDLKVAEHEAIARIETSMRAIGYSAIRIDQNGFRLDNGALIQAQDAIFCLDLHFLTPKVFPGISVAALWNPSDFYRLFGLEQSLRNQLSHDLYAAANVSRATDWLKIVAPSLNPTVFALNHTVPDNFLPPNPLGPDSLFYIGIGWDKTAGQGHRHQRLLKEIEMEVALDIYGPNRLADNSRPWAGFSSYRGELPFDGFSVLEAANKSGVSLALSSESHLRSGISSNRLFESIAAGALPVVEKELDPPFDLSGSIFISTSDSPAEAVAKIKAEIQNLQANPDVFVKRVLTLQKRMRHDFTLDRQLPAIVRAAESLWAKNLAIENSESTNTVDILSLLKGYIGSGSSEGLNSNQIRHLSRANFLHHISGYLSKSNAEWVTFSQDSNFLKQVRYQVLASQDLSDLDALHFQGSMTRGEDVPNSSLSQSVLKADFRSLDSFVIRKDLILNWISNNSGYFTVVSLLELIHEDSLSTKPVLNHRSYSQPIFRIPEQEMFHIAGLRSEEDLLILGRDYFEGLLPSFNSLLEMHSKLRLQSVTAIPLDYRLILTALAQMPLREIPTYIRHGIQLTLRRLMFSRNK